MKMSEKITREDIGDSIREINAHQKVVEKKIKDSGEKFAKDLFNFACGIVRLQAKECQNPAERGGDERDEDQEFRWKHRD